MVKYDKVVLYDKDKTMSIYDVEQQKMTSYPKFNPSRYYSFSPLKQRKELVLVAGWVTCNQLALFNLNDGTF